MTLLHDFLADSAKRAPDSPAFIHGDVSTSYGELHEQSSRLAGSLVQLGIESGDRVALLLDGCVEYIIAYYGILTAGGVVVPVCPDTRTEILKKTLEHSGARAVVMEPRNLRYLPKEPEALPELRLVAVVGTLPETADDARLRSFEDMCINDGDYATATISPQDLAAINYTSGTTGEPKGVMLTHENLVENVRSIVEYLRLTPDDRIAMVLPFYYVYGNSVLHTHIMAGASVCVAGSLAFPAKVLQTMVKQRCTGFSGVPSTFARLLKVKNLSDYDLSALRYVTQAGAAMTREVTQQLRSALRSADIFVMYGQTEAAARLAYVPPTRLDEKLGSAGCAIPGVTLTIRDENGVELPRGSQGEVTAQGRNIMQGYWNDPVGSAHALTPNGLRTGDLGTMDEDGFLFLIGRDNELIKSGGHRIAPQKIEDVINRLDGVSECAVTGMADEMLGQV
ncbi:MAG: acyl--CoA ligase, partial [Deltaproteobacteria bacterium]|nr:acyl--CoA ligase [Deltaproteobacteria bacterium]